MWDRIERIEQKKTWWQEIWMLMLSKRQFTWGFMAAWSYLDRQKWSKHGQRSHEVGAGHNPKCYKIWWFHMPIASNCLFFWKVALNAFAARCSTLHWIWILDFQGFYHCKKAFFSSVFWQSADCFNMFWAWFCPILGHSSFAIDSPVAGARSPSSGKDDQTNRQRIWGAVQSGVLVGVTMFLECAPSHVHINVNATIVRM